MYKIFLYCSRSYSPAVVTPGKIIDGRTDRPEKLIPVVIDILDFEFSSNTAHVRETESNRRVRGREKTRFRIFLPRMPRSSLRRTEAPFLFIDVLSLSSLTITKRRTFLEVTHPFIMRFRAKRLSRFLNLDLALPPLVAIIDHSRPHLVDIIFTS